jgi:hypothetical protein
VGTKKSGKKWLRDGTVTSPAKAKRKSHDFRYQKTRKPHTVEGAGLSLIRDSLGRQAPLFRCCRLAAVRYGAQHDGVGAQQVGAGAQQVDAAGAQQDDREPQLLPQPLLQHFVLWHLVLQHFCLQHLLPA